MRAYGPRCLLSSLNGGIPDINASMGMTKAAVLPEPRSHCFRLRKGGAKRLNRTSLSDSDDVSVLKTNWNCLPLDRRRVFVSDLINDI